LDRNILHFGQAQGSPFTTALLVDKFGYDGMNFHGEALTQAGLLPSGLDNIYSATKDILDRI
jgi:hypothetical protein